MDRRRLAAAVVVLGVLVARVAGGPSSFARAAGPAQDAAAIVPLDEKNAVERPIARGERHRYSATLTAGEFLFVVVDQRGIDLAVRLVDAAGTVVAECDSPNGPTGPERIAVIAPHSGSYVLEVSVGDPASAPGRYAVRVGAHRMATAGDVSHTEAERLYAEAQALIARPTADNRRDAATRLARAYALFLAQGQRYEAALVASSEGSMHMQAGTPLAARTPLLAARDLLERGDPVSSFVLDNLGGLYDLLGEPDTAIGYYQAALVVATAAADRTHEAQLHNNIGVIYARQSDWPAALEQYRQSLATFRATGDRRREALALHNIGVSYQSARELTRSREFFEQALAIRHAIGDADGEASTLMQLGQNAVLTGDLQNAIARLDAARKLQTRPRNPVREAQIVSRLGHAYLLDGQPEKALTALDSAVTLSRTAGDRSTEALAQIWEADTHFALHDLPAASAAADAALALAEPLHDGTRVGLALQRQARAFRERGELDTALTSITRALAAFEGVRAGVSTPELRATFAGRNQDAYTDALDLLMQLDDRRPGTGFAAQALQVAERARARGLLDLLAESGADLRHGIPATLLDRQRALARTLDAKADRLVALQRGAPSAELEALSREVSALDTEYEELRASLRRQSPAYASLTQPEPLAPAAIQRDLLDAQTTLVEYALGDAASYAWVVQPATLARRSARAPPRHRGRRARGVRAADGTRTDRVCRNRRGSSTADRERGRSTAGRAASRVGSGARAARGSRYHHTSGDCGGWRAPIPAVRNAARAVITPGGAAIDRRLRDRVTAVGLHTRRPAPAARRPAARRARCGRVCRPGVRHARSPPCRAGDITGAVRSAPAGRVSTADPPGGRRHPDGTHPAAAVHARRGQCDPVCGGRAAELSQRWDSLPTRTRRRAQRSRSIAISTSPRTACSTRSGRHCRRSCSRSSVRTVSRAKGSYAPTSCTTWTCTPTSSS